MAIRKPIGLARVSIWIRWRVFVRRVELASGVDYVRTADVKDQIELSGNDIQAVSMTGERLLSSMVFGIDNPSPCCLSFYVCILTIDSWYYGRPSLAGPILAQISNLEKINMGYYRIVEI